MVNKDGKTRIGIIKEYFGDVDNGLTWLQELRPLTPEERQELAVGAAKEMGLAQDKLAFPLDD